MTVWHLIDVFDASGGVNLIVLITRKFLVLHCIPDRIGLLGDIKVQAREPRRLTPNRTIWDSGPSGRRAIHQQRSTTTT